MYELFEHTADLGLRVEADSVEGLFAESGRGLLAMLVDNPAEVHSLQSWPVELAADEREYLLFDWLNELLFKYESERLLPAEFDIDISEGRLTATIRGEPADPARHRLSHEVKAITYHGLLVEPTETGWRAELIVDI